MSTKHIANIPLNSEMLALYLRSGTRKPGNINFSSIALEFVATAIREKEKKLKIFFEKSYYLQSLYIKNAKGNSQQY